MNELMIDRYVDIVHGGGRRRRRPTTLQHSIAQQSTAQRSAVQYYNVIIYIRVKTYTVRKVKINVP